VGLVILTSVVLLAVLAAVAAVGRLTVASCVFARDCHGRLLVIVIATLPVRVGVVRAGHLEDLLTAASETTLLLFKYFTFFTRGRRS
jgi:hypothetical protein